jgi:hypothetical protein
MWMMALGFFSTAHTFTCRPFLSAACTQRANTHRACGLSRLDGLVCTECCRQGLGPAPCKVSTKRTDIGFLYHCTAQQQFASKETKLAPCGIHGRSRLRRQPGPFSGPGWQHFCSAIAMHALLGNYCCGSWYTSAARHYHPASDCVQNTQDLLLCLLCCTVC